jgi:hypothetical protein
MGTENQTKNGNDQLGHLSIIGQVVTVEDWSEIQVLASCEGLNSREIAR